MTILIADDEISITSLLGDYFSPKYDVLIAKDGSQAYDIFKSHIDEINLCIFDYMMPAINGIELCKMVKSIKRLPVIIFTAKTEDEIQLLAFDNSADEYISKPFSIKVLNARLERLISLYYTEPLNTDNTLVYGNIVIHPNSYTAIINNKQLHLSPREFKLLVFLVQHSNKVVSINDIIKYLYGSEIASDAKNIIQIINTLRKKILFYGGDVCIKNIYGVGYKLDINTEPPVEKSMVVEC